MSTLPMGKDYYECRKCEKRSCQTFYNYNSMASVCNYITVTIRFFNKACSIFLICHS